MFSNGHIYFVIVYTYSSLDSEDVLMIKELVGLPQKEMLLMQYASYKPCIYDICIYLPDVHLQQCALLAIWSAGLAKLHLHTA